MATYGHPHQVEALQLTSIISPPPMKGGMVSSTSIRPHRNPTPVGPHILWLEATIQSGPRLWTSITMCGTLWQQSSRNSAPTSRHLHSTQPVELETDQSLCHLKSMLRWADQVTCAGNDADILEVVK